jgi:hypothetical protein
MGATGAAQGQVAATHAAYTVEPFTPPSPITINATGVRLRAEPFATTDTPVLSAGSAGFALNVVGIARLPGWNWYQVALKNGQKAFIRSDLTTAPSPGGAPAGVQPTPVASPSTSYTPVAAPAPRPLPAPTAITQYPAASSSPVYPSAPSNTAISLTPKSPVPEPLADTPRAGDPSGLQSLPAQH